MHDQADELRQLVQRGAATETVHTSERSRLIVVTGGKGGVGTTTVAVRLAAILAQTGSTLLVDGDFDHADATLLCGIEPQTSVGDVLAGRCDVQQAIEHGPAGLAVLPGGWPPETRADTSALAQGRLLSGLVGLAAEFDTIVVDAGNGVTRRVQRFWNAADLALLVTTPDLTAVMDTYSALKLLASDGALVPVELVVNRAPCDPSRGNHQTDDVYRRLARSAQRFLGIDLGLAGSIDDGTSVATVGRLRGESAELALPSGTVDGRDGVEDGIGRVVRKVLDLRRPSPSVA